MGTSHDKREIQQENKENMGKHERDQEQKKKNNKKKLMQEQPNEIQEDKEENQRKPENFRTSLIEIKIIMNFFLIWKKTYNINETFKKIFEDFISEIQYEKGFEIKWTYKDINIEFNSTKIKKFITENNILDVTTLEIKQEIIEGNSKNVFEYVDYVAIPSFNPFTILIYNKEENYLKKLKLEENKLSNHLIKFGIESTYCNGGNHFFILGGINNSTKEEVGLFLDINLKKESIKNTISISPIKRNHSMLYSEKKVYIVGGNDNNTLYYSLKDKIVEEMGKLNKKRFEPSLIRHSDYLYCFDASKKNEEIFSFEKKNICDMTYSSWEIIYPKISPKLGDNVYNQKFFGIVEDKKYNIIFLGGLYDNYSEENFDPNSAKFNIKYNLLTNTMEKSDIPFQEISLNEKTFLSWDENCSFLLIKTHKKKPRIINFFKSDNSMVISNLKFSEIEEKKKKNNPFYKFSNMKNSLIGLNFDMPTKVGKINILELKSINENAELIKINEETNKIIAEDKKIGNIEINRNNVTNDNIINGDVTETNIIPNNDETNYEKNIKINNSDTDNKNKIEEEEKKNINNDVNNINNNLDNEQKDNKNDIINGTKIFNSHLNDNKINKDNNTFNIENQENTFDINQLDNNRIINNKYDDNNININNKFVDNDKTIKNNNDTNNNIDNIDNIYNNDGNNNDILGIDTKKLSKLAKRNEPNYISKKQIKSKLKKIQKQNIYDLNENNY